MKWERIRPGRAPLELACQTENMGFFGRDSTFSLLGAAQFSIGAAPVRFGAAHGALCAAQFHVRVAIGGAVWAWSWADETQF